MSESDAGLIQSLRATLGKMQVALGSVQESIVWTDTQGQIQWGNSSLETLTQKSRLVVLSSRLCEILPLEFDGRRVSEDMYPVARAQEGQTIHTGTYDFFPEPGRRTILEISAGTFSVDACQVSVVLVIRDVTRQKTTEQNLLKKTQLLRMLERVSAAANESMAPKTALEIALKEVCAYTGWPLGHVYIRSKHPDDTLAPSHIWFPSEPEKFSDFKKTTMSSFFKRGVGLPGRVFDQMKAVWIENVSVDPNFPRALNAYQSGLRAGFGFPVQVGADLKAVLEFFSLEIMQPDPALLDAMTQVGVQIGRVFERQSTEMQIRSAFDELQNSNLELKKAQSQLVQADRLAAIGQLAAGVAHEINNPLGFVQSNLSSLGRYLEALMESYQCLHKLCPEPVRSQTEDTFGIAHIRQDLPELLAETRNGLDRIKKIVADLKTFSRSDSSSLMMPEDINAILESVLSIVHNETKYKADIVRHLEPLPLVACNAQQIGQVFINMLINAAQAIADRGIIEINTRACEKQIIISIQDSGSGIPENVLSKIFDPFFTTKKVGEGTGLGLSISYDIIKKHGGRIMVSSQLGAGTCFTIYLPIQN